MIFGLIHITAISQAVCSGAQSSEKYWLSAFLCCQMFGLEPVRGERWTCGWSFLPLFRPGQLSHVLSVRGSNLDYLSPSFLIYSVRDSIAARWKLMNAVFIINVIKNMSVVILYLFFFCFYFYRHVLKFWSIDLDIKSYLSYQTFIVW